MTRELDTDRDFDGLIEVDGELMGYWLPEPLSGPSGADTAPGPATSEGSASVGAPVRIHATGAVRAPEGASKNG